MSSTSSPLQSSSTVEEFIVVLQQIVARNHSCDRSEENVAIILTSKIQLVANNRTNQDLLQALGEFFMWMIPNTESLTGAERQEQEKERERGRKICSSKELEELFVHLLLPFAKSSDAIFSLCRSVSCIALKSDNTYFVTAAARDELLKLVKNAPCQNSLHCALQAIHNLSNARKEGVPIKSNPFICDEVSTIAYKLFCESTIPKIVELAADLFRIQVGNSTPQFCSADPHFARKMLRKLDEATETETMSSIANLIDIILHKKQGNGRHFASGEAARVYLSKLTSSDDPRVLALICRCIYDAAFICDNISDDFASPEMCRAIFKCFSKQKNEHSKGNIMFPIGVLTHFFPRARSTFAQECPGLTQVIIEMLTSATDDKMRCSVASVVAGISHDPESAKRLFNHVSLYEALIRAASFAQDDRTKRIFLGAMRNATMVCTDFLPICAARYPFYDERQIELLKIDSLDSLVSNLEQKAWKFDAPQDADFLKLRSILIVLEKFDQFLEVLDQRIEAGDKRIEEMLLTIAKGFSFMVQKYWEPLLGDRFVDVTLSLLERSSGAANAVFVNVIWNILLTNCSLTIYPSAVVRLLQKLDNSKEVRDREFGDFKMEFDIYKILEAAVTRNPELFRDSTFLVDNSALIRSCFERSFEIQKFNANCTDLPRWAFHLEALSNKVFK